MTRRTYTDDERAAAIALYVEAGPTAVQRELGVPKGTVTAWAKVAGVGTVRNERMGEAIEAHMLDAKARRAGLVDKLVRVADEALDVELAKLAKSDLRDVVGARTRAIHDLQLLTGAATARTETVSSASIDDEVAALAEQLGLRSQPAAPVAG
jgi:transposase-like protein